MAIDFDSETIEITGNLMRVEGYLDCEKIIIHNIKKHLKKGNSDENIILYLRQLLSWFEGRITVKHVNDHHTNYRYAAGFVDTLLKIPYWKSWMNTVDV